MQFDPRSKLKRPKGTQIREAQEKRPKAYSMYDEGLFS